MDGNGFSKLQIKNPAFDGRVPSSKFQVPSNQLLFTLNPFTETKK